MSSGKTILIVDDDQIVLQTLKTIFEKAGFQVQAASTADQAIGIFREKEISLVLLDFALPDNGEWLGPEIRRTKPNVPIAVLSGDPGAVQARSFADVLIAKPESPPTLLGIVSKLLKETSGIAA